ncbi:hypothetical protein [Marinobacter sp. NFXS9]|uniref:hypothetical protein n=1 Tax=Marinobacter sp. NFXS9 TaxID=2818433 RepID=UPI0032DFF09D
MAAVEGGITGTRPDWQSILPAMRNTGSVVARDNNVFVEFDFHCCSSCVAAGLNSARRNQTMFINYDVNKHRQQSVKPVFDQGGVSPEVSVSGVFRPFTTSELLTSISIFERSQQNILIGRWLLPF